jgi:hypothetical protein
VVVVTGDGGKYCREFQNYQESLDLASSESVLYILYNIVPNLFPNK